MIIRDATLDDAKGIAHVHVRSWQTTYKGLMPDEVIASRGIENRTRIWTRILENDERQSIVLVAEDNDGKIVGFVNGGKPQEDFEGFDSELYAIYLLQEAQGKGIGRKLMQACAKELSNKGFKSMVLWVLVGNDKSAGFYEHMGGTPVAEGEYSPTEGTRLKKLAYGWKDIRTLLVAESE